MLLLVATFLVSNCSRKAARGLGSQHATMTENYPTKMNENNCYSLLSVPEAKLELDQLNKDFENDGRRLDSGAREFLLGRRVLLFPAQLGLGTESIIFESEECYGNYVEKGFFPVDDLKDNIFKKEEPRTRELNKGLGMYSQIFQDRYGIDLNSPRRTELLYSKLAGRKKDAHLDLFLLGILLGDNVINTVGGAWKYVVRYEQYNRYYIPVVITDDNKVLDPSDHLDMLYWPRKPTYEKFIHTCYNYLEHLASPFPSPNQKIVDEVGEY